MIVNQIKTVILLGVLTGILLAVGSIWGRGGLLIALVFALLLNFGSYWFSSSIVLKMYRAKPAEETSKLYLLTAELAKKANLPMPKVYIIPSAQANAFATGRSPKHAAVAATTGILQLLSDEELKGVLAHELAHIKNRDTLIATIAATIAGVISYLATMAQWAALFGLRDDDGASIVQMLVLAILTPILATIIQLAISRSREFLADARGAKIAGSGLPLADALVKLSHDSNPMQLGTQATASLFISNPMKGKRFFSLLSTHPDTAERVRRLRAMSV